MLSQQVLATLSAALFGAALTLLAGYGLAQRWRSLRPRARVLFGGAFAVFEIVFWLALYGYFIVPNGLAVREISIESDQWRGDPLRIAVLGDVGITGPHGDASRVEDAVARIDAAHPDLVVLLGNYVAGLPAARRSDRDREQIARGFTAYALLNSPMGVVAVLGDRDSDYGSDAIVRGLEDAGVAVLSNRSVATTRHGENIIIAGLDPAHPDMDDALDGAPPGRIIAISHAQRGLVDWAGHTDLLLTTCAQGPCGERDEHGDPLYATSGLGLRGFRVFNPPEIAIITLHAPEAAPH